MCLSDLHNEGRITGDNSEIRGTISNTIDHMKDDDAIAKACIKSVTGSKNSKKAYYIKVCAYKNVNGKKVYGRFSAVKKIKVK